MLIADRPVRVFKNWARGCYSIMQDGVVQASARQILLRRVEFRVRQQARERMLATGRRNVHAFAVGDLVDFVHPEDRRELISPVLDTPVIYDPQRFSSFVERASLQPVRTAVLARFDEGGVWCRLQPGDEVPARAA